MNSSELYNHIKDCLLYNVPVSVLRAGDGEYYVLNGEYEYVLKRQIGYVPEEKELIRERLIEAYTKADIIGIPVKNRFLSDPDSSWSKVKPTLEKAIWPHEKLFTDIDFHSHFLANGWWDELLSEAETLCYVSCRNLDERFRKKYGIKNVYSFIISPEVLFEEKKESNHLEQYFEVKEWIKTIPASGNLCLFGAGVIGKSYGNWFRDAGGIAIDAGSVFDSFAGLKTRGVGRGVNVIDETYKL